MGKKVWKFKGGAWDNIEWTCPQLVTTIELRVPYTTTNRNQWELVYRVNRKHKCYTYVRKHLVFRGNK